VSILLQVGSCHQKIRLRKYHTINAQLDDFVDNQELIDSLPEKGQIITLCRTFFSQNMAMFYKAINTFEAYSLDAQDGLLAEQKRAETEINLQRAEQRSAIGTLAGGIAHDFNNLLTAILGNINLATYCLHQDHNVYNNLVDAEKATRRAHKLTDQLLTFSKGGGPVKQTASINEIIRESTFFILHGSNVDCKIVIPDNLWTVDKGQIGRVIQNLTLNADHAMPDGGTITIRCKNHTAMLNSPS